MSEHSTGPDAGGNEQANSPSVSTPDRRRRFGRRTIIVAAAAVIVMVVVAAILVQAVGPSIKRSLGLQSEIERLKYLERRDQTLAALSSEYATVPAGSFTMGSPSSEDGRYDDENQHRVTISRPFFLKKTVVTEGEWRELMGNHRSSPHYARGRNHPKVLVNWYETLSYLNKLSAREGLEACYELSSCVGTPGLGVEDYECSEVSFQGLSCEGYRLPTEAEWEYAARAGNEGPRYGRLNRIAWHNRNSRGTSSVGRKAPNEWGLYDMIGNVMEWTADWYADSYPSGSVTDPQGASTGTRRVARSCGWYNNETGLQSGCGSSGNARSCRAANRESYSPLLRHDILGFRPARTASR